MVEHNISPEKTIGLTGDQIKKIGDFYAGKVVKVAQEVAPAAPAGVDNATENIFDAGQAETVPEAAPAAPAGVDNATENNFDSGQPDVAVQPEVAAQPTDQPAEQVGQGNLEENIFNVGQPDVAEQPEIAVQPAVSTGQNDLVGNIFDPEQPEVGPQPMVQPEVSTELEAGYLNTPLDEFGKGEETNEQMIMEQFVQSAPEESKEVSEDDLVGRLNAVQSTILNAYMEIDAIKEKLAAKKVEPNDQTLHM